MTEIIRTRGRLPQRITVKIKEKGFSCEAATAEGSFNEWKDWLQGKVEEQQKRAYCRLGGSYDIQAWCKFRDAKNQQDHEGS